jgi:hypothetical protein
MMQKATLHTSKFKQFFKMTHPNAGITVSWILEESVSHHSAIGSPLPHKDTGG